MAFHVPQYGQQMIIRLDRERLESSLVEVTGALGVIVRVPAHRVGVRQPSEEVRQLGIGFRPDDEMPVIGHHGTGEDGQVSPGDRFGEDPFEGLVVVGLLEQRQPPGRHGSAHESTFRRDRYEDGVAWPQGHPTKARKQ